MKISKKGVDLITRWEGCKLTAYQDSVGVWTIGYGHTTAAGAPKVVKGLKITQQEAIEIFTRDVVKYERAVEKVLRRTPTQAQFDAMVSLCYNIGPGNFAKSSVVRMFNSGDFAGAAHAFSMWNKAKGKVLTGLTNRRADEARHFMLKSVEPAMQAVPAAPVAPPAPKVPEPTPPLDKPAPPVLEYGTAGTVLVVSGSTFLGVPLWVAGAICGVIVVAALVYMLLNRK